MYSILWNARLEFGLIYLLTGMKGTGTNMWTLALMLLTTAILFATPTNKEPGKESEVMHHKKGEVQFLFDTGSVDQRPLLANLA